MTDIQDLDINTGDLVAMKRAMTNPWSGVATGIVMDTGHTVNTGEPYALVSFGSGLQPTPYFRAHLVCVTLGPDGTPRPAETRTRTKETTMSTSENTSWIWETPHEDQEPDIRRYDSYDQACDAALDAWGPGIWSGDTSAVTEFYAYSDEKADKDNDEDRNPSALIYPDKKAP